MPSTNPNIFKRAYENVMGTPEQNKKAKEDIEKYKASKAKEKEKEEAEKKMNKGGYAKKTAKPKKKVHKMPDGTVMKDSAMKKVKKK